MKICITGTTSGIGQQLKKDLEQLGHEILSVNRNTHDLNQPIDWSSTDLKGFDILINNAGHYLGKAKFLEHNFDSIVKMYNTNVVNLIGITQKFMLDNSQGTVINILSTTLEKTAPYGSSLIYYLNKKNVEDLINALMEEYKKFRFVKIYPGRTKTQIRKNSGMPLTEEQANFTGKDSEHLTVKEVSDAVIMCIENQNLKSLSIQYPKKLS